MPARPCLGVLVDQSSSPAGQQVELALEVLHLEAYVVKRLAAAVDEPGYRPVRVRGLDELQLRSAHAQQGRPDPLVGDLPDLRGLQTEQVPVEFKGVLEVSHGYADVVQALDRAGPVVVHGVLLVPRSPGVPNRARSVR